MDRDPEAYYFSPAESSQWHRDQRTAKRKTQPRQGNCVGTNRKKNPKRQPGTKFGKDSYRRAIVRAGKKAGVEHWTPHQLRHLTITEIRKALGLEAPMYLVGHTKVTMTDHYAEVSKEMSIKAARAAPSL